MPPASNLVRLPNPPTLSWDDCRLLVESVVDYAIFMLDDEGRVATWNLGAEKIHGHAAADVVGKHFSKLFPPEAIAAGKPEAELRQAAERGRVENEGWRVRNDGSRFWANVVTTALRDDGGKLRGFAKVSRDLSARHAEQERFRQSEERFHRLVDAVTDYAIYMLDADGHVASWNPGAERIKGYAPAEIIGQHFSHFYTEEDRRAGKPERILETVRQTGRFAEENWRVRKDGTRFWASVVITALSDEAGHVNGFVKVTRDLTERRLTEEALRRSEERFRLLLENISDYALYMLDPEGRVTTWNRGAERLTQYTPIEVMGQSFELFFSAEDRAAGKPAAELAIARAQGRHEDEGWRLRKDGSRFWANAILNVVRDAQGNLLGFAKITRDLTARRDAEERARYAHYAAREAEEAAQLAEQSARAASEASKAKDEFLAVVSHELRTPLNAILGWATLLKDRVSEPAAKKPVDVIHRNALAQVKIIDDILDMSRVIAGKFRIDPKPADLVAIVGYAIEVVRPAASAKGVDISFHPERDVCLLVADPERLQQVVWNLLSNSVKFTEPGGQIAITLRSVNSRIVLEITDTGQGIDPAFLPFVFERFRQADSSMTRRAGGLGLGLALVRHIVQLHGGKVSASSAGRGKGATFRVEVPIKAVIPAGQAVSADRADTAPVSTLPIALKGVRVLVVDDEPDARDIVATVLMEAGAEVEMAPSAAEGFELLQRFHPDVLASDVGMPGEDGLAFIRRIRAHSAEHAQIPALALTAFAQEVDKSRALQAGFNAHLGKPVEPAVLVAAVAELARPKRRSPH